MKEEINSIGTDVYIDSDASIKRKSLCNIGNHVAIDKGFYCTTQLTIGDYVHVGPYVVLIGGEESSVIFEDFSFAATGTKIIAGSEEYGVDHLMGPLIPRKFRTLKLTTVKFEKFAGCGANTIIMPGITLAEGSLVAAGSLVNKDTQPWTVYAGYPARPIKKRNKKNTIKQAKEMGYKYE